MAEVYENSVMNKRHQKAHRSGAACPESDLKAC